MVDMLELEMVDKLLNELIIRQTKDSGFETIVIKFNDAVFLDINDFYAISKILPTANYCGRDYVYSAVINKRDQQVEFIVDSRVGKSF